jgi:branched-chain amino acid transport system permease protein
MTLQEFLQHLVNGFTLGGMFALVALGYTMVYGILELINFAHGDIFMVGSFLGLFALNFLMGHGIDQMWVALPAALIFAMAGAAALGVTVERLAYRPLRGAPKITVLVSAIGASIFISNFVMLTAGRNLKPFPQLKAFSDVSSEGFVMGGVSIQYIQIVIVALSVVLMFALDAFVNRTRLGRGMRATAQDPEAAQMMGVPINRVIVLTFILGSALAAAGGVMNGLYYGGIKFSDGFIIGVKAFTAAVLGGIGNIRGAMLGGFVLGLCETVIIALLNAARVPEAFDYKDAIAFLILVAILTLRPSGILGSHVPEKV